MAALVQMADGVCIAVANTLRSNLSPVLADIKAAYASSDTSEFGYDIPLNMPNKILTRQRKVLPNPPLIIVSSIGGDVVANGAPVWGEVEHHLDVAIFTRSDKIEIAEAQCDRYLQAIWTVLMQHQTLDGSLSGLSGVDTPRYGKSPIYGEKVEAIVGWAASWEVVVHVMESVAS